MNYEEKYKQALERARDLHDNHPLGQPQTWITCEKIFPELKESEDERIRKAIICGMNALKEQHKETFASIPINDCIAWLEKQDIKLQEYINEERNKKGFYCEGKEMSWNEMSLYIRKHDYPYYFKDDLDCYPFNVEKQCKQKPTDEVKPKFKVGDWVQIDGGHVMKVLEVKKDVLCYRILNWYGNESVRKISDIDSIAHLWTIQDAKKGDVLQANKCTLIFDSLTKDIDGNTVISSWYFCDTIKFYGLGTSQSDLWSIEGVVPATKEQRDLLFQKMKESGYEWDAEKKVLRKFEQNSTWSEEDEAKLRDVIRLVEQGAPVRPISDHYTDWLKSLKDRFQLQPKQEWNEEDEEMYNEVLTDIIYAKNDLKTKGCLGLSERAMKAFNWFSIRHKSLRPQSKWKPSEEQLTALKDIIIGKRGPLYDLYFDLEKL